MKKILVSLILLASSSYLYADGDITRPATQAEKVFFRTVIETARKAVPESFAGFRIVDASEPYEPEDISEGSEKRPLSVTFSGQWVNDEMEQAANEKMQQIADTISGDISKSPQMLAKMKKRDEILAKMDQAGKKNDIAAIGKLSIELQAISKEIDKLYEPAINAIPSEDYKLRTTIEVNTLTYDLSQSIYKEIAPVKGYKTFYYHDNDEGENKRPDRVMIFVGNWSSAIENETYILKLNKKNLPHTTVQSYVISVNGTKEYTQKFIDGLNFKLLASLPK
jgi:hypothetical protein